MAWAEAARESRSITPSFRGASKTRTRNLEIPRCAIAHLRSACLAAHPGMTGGLRDAFEKGLFRRVHRVGGPDMHPDAVEPESKQPLLLVGAIEHLGQ